MVAPQSTSVSPGRRGSRRRPVRLVDLLALLAIVVIGATGAFAAGIWAMPANGTPSGHSGPAMGQTTGLAVAGVSDAAVSGTADAPAGAGNGAAAVGPASSAPGATSLTPSTPSLPSASLAKGTPWNAWKPAGPGVATSFQLPAPWVGGTRQVITVSVYLPGGYTASTRSYPVIYEAPFSYRSWNMWIGVKAMLDAQIASGAMPASIVVFVQPAHGPYHDSECANSADGRQQLDTFLSSTLVQAIDSRYRTIQTPAARSVVGFSQGGFCASMLALRHPNVFSTAGAISGYYQAGIRNGQTANAWMPFGGKASLEAAYSPLRLVGQLTPAQRAAMLLVLEADPAQPFYGPQYQAMIAAAHRAGVAVLPVAMPVYHSWAAVRQVLPRMLRSIGAHEAALGVFG
ncbi:MAG: alpha/beta hydrolase [Candidatus Limnocylindrales bacterium]